MIGVQSQSFVQSQAQIGSFGDCRAQVTNLFDVVLPKNSIRNCTSQPDTRRIE